MRTVREIGWLTARAEMMTDETFSEWLEISTALLEKQFDASGEIGRRYSRESAERAERIAIEKDRLADISDDYEDTDSGDYLEEKRATYYPRDYPR